MGKIIKGIRTKIERRREREKKTRNIRRMERFYYSGRSGFRRSN